MSRPGLDVVQWVLAALPILERIAELRCVCHPMDRECRCLGPAAARILGERGEA